MAEFFAMGGYAAYVWPAYGIAALVMVGLLAASLSGLRAGEATLKALQDSRPQRRRPRRGQNETAGTPSARAGAAEVGEG